MEKFKEVLAGVAFFGVLIFLCSDLGMAIWNSLFVLAFCIAVLAAVVMTWINAFKKLGDKGRFLLSISTMAFLFYLSEHRDALTIVLGVLFLGTIVYASIKSDTYHGHNDDMWQ